MTAQDVYKRLVHFIDNDFTHLRAKVDWLFYTIIGGLLAIISLLVFKK